MTRSDAILKQAQRRDVAGRALRSGGVGLCAGLLAAIILVLIDRLQHADVPFIAPLIAIALGGMAGLIHAWRSRDDQHDLAVRLDNVLRLKDRLATAAAINRTTASPLHDGEFAELVKQDAERLAGTVDVARALPVHLTRSWAGVLILAATWWAALTFMPRIDWSRAEQISPEQIALAEQAKQENLQQVEELSQALDQAKDALPPDAADDPRTAEQLAALDRLSQQLNSPPRDATNAAEDSSPAPEEVQRARDESAAQLDELAERMAEQSQRELAAADEMARRFQGLNNQDIPKPPLSAEEFTEAIKRGDFGDAATQLEQLLNNDQLSESERREIAKHLRELGESVEQLEATDPAALNERREQTAQALRDQGVSEEDVQRLLDETPEAAEDIERELIDRGVDESAAHDLARDVDRLNEQQQRDQQVNEDTRKVSDALDRAAEQMETPPPPPPPPTSQPSATSKPSQSASPPDAGEDRANPQAGDQSAPQVGDADEKTTSTDQSDDRAEPSSSEDSSQQQQQQQQQKQSPQTQEQQSSSSKDQQSTASKDSKQSPTTQPQRESSDPSKQSGEQSQQQQKQQEGAPQSGEQSESSPPTQPTSSADDETSQQPASRPHERPGVERQEPSTSPDAKSQATTRAEENASTRSDQATATTSPDSQQQSQKQQPAQQSSPQNQRGDAQRDSQNQRQSTEQTPDQQQSQQQQQSPQNNRDQKNSGDQTQQTPQNGDQQQSGEPDPNQPLPDPSELLKQLGERGREAQEKGESSEKLRELARKIAQNMTPEQRKQWAEQWARQAGENPPPPPPPMQSTPSGDQPQSPDGSMPGPERNPEQPQDQPGDGDQPPSMPPPQSSGNPKPGDDRENNPDARTSGGESDDQQEPEQPRGDGIGGSQTNPPSSSNNRTPGDQPGENPDGTARPRDDRTGATPDQLDLRGKETADQLITRWLSDQQMPDPNATPGTTTGSNGPAAPSQRVRQAQDVAERAVNESAVSKRYHQALKRYFNKLPQTLKNAAQPAPISPVPTKPAPSAPTAPTPTAPSGDGTS